MTYPIPSLIAWLCRVLSQPGMAEFMQNWPASPDDHKEMVPPISVEEWMANLDVNQPLGDMSNSWGWRANMADDAGDTAGGDLVYDQSRLDPPVRLSSLPYGLLLSMNIDWFQSTKEGNYSNVCLATILQGPKEPGDYALDQMMEPIADDIRELQSATGFLRTDFPFHDLHEDLQNAYFWKSLETAEEHQVFFEETGNWFTILDILPGWHTATQSPPDTMHLLYLGGANWILKQIIMGLKLPALR
ncbi:hypothetical protein FRC06_010283 [Ceratobasidium sp. 370]|nr:hypothetical protein FRC06_010283 [Ceratobasidium sp. 370]